MDVRLRQIISESAGTYFIVTDKSQVPQIAAEPKMRLYFINTEKGAVNQLFKFAKGDVAGFTSVFGKQSRMQEKRGNFSISTCLDALAAGPIAVVNLRAFNETDMAQTIGMGLHPNTLQEKHDVNYPELFNRNGFWVPEGKNIIKFNNNDQLLNFANVGNSNLSIIVTKAVDVSTITDEGDKTLIQTVLEIDEFPALDFEMLVKDTFVDVYLFKNNITNEGVHTNQYYGHLFNENGELDVSRLNELVKIPESGFTKKYTGSLIPGLISERGANINIDSVINQDYMENGLIAHINDDVLELSNESGVFDIFGMSYHDNTGSIISSNDYLFSHVVPTQLTEAEVSYPPVTGDENVEPIEANIITYGCEKENDTTFIGAFEQGLRIGNYIKGVNGLVTVKEIEELGSEIIPLTNFEILKNITDVDLAVVGREITAEVSFPTQDEIEVADFDDYNIDAVITSDYPITSGTEIEILYNDTLLGIATLTENINSIYLSELIQLIPGFTGDVRTPLANHITVDGLVDTWKFNISGIDNLNTLAVNSVVSNDDFVSYDLIASSNQLPQIIQSIFTKIKYTCTGAIEFSDVDTKIKKINPFNSRGLVKPTLLNGYVVRNSQFTDGTASRQKEILDMMITPGILKGIRGTKGIRYVVDCFKSFVENGYKYQFGQFCETLDQSNKFIRAIINEPFIEDLEKSQNPLFKQTPNGIFDISYLPEGGNKTYSSKFLNKFSVGADKCFFFGPGNRVSTIVKPISGKVSNLFYLKRIPFDVLANESGYVDGIDELEILFDDIDRKYLEAFNWNPIINLDAGNSIFGNLTGQKIKSAQQQIHNSELLAYIKESLFNLSRGEAFKKGAYDDYLRTETESKSFMDSLALQGAIEPDHVVICNATNNTREISQQKLKLVHIEYTPIDALEKVVFDLTIR